MNTSPAPQFWNKPGTPKLIFVASIIVLAYFLIMFTIAEYRSDVVLIGVFVELLTLPMLAVGLAVLVGSVILLFRKKSVYAILSLLFILTTIFLLSQQD